MEPMDKEVIIVDKDILKILAVDTRMDILKELRKGDRTLSDLSRILKKDKSTIMEHLTILAKAGLVKRIQNPGKKFVFYALTEKGSNIFVEKQRAFEIKESRILTLLLIAVVGILLIGGSGVYYYYKVLPSIEQSQVLPSIKSQSIQTPPLGEGDWVIIHILSDIFSYSILGFFYPKYAGGTCGLCPPPPAVQRIEYNCIGFKYEYQPHCPDCGSQMLCFGIVTGEKRCYTYINYSIPIEVPCT
jgi:DNA-binding transcriptional ArsR family regulator